MESLSTVDPDQSLAERLLSGESFLTAAEEFFCATVCEAKSDSLTGVVLLDGGNLHVQMTAFWRGIARSGGASLDPGLLRNQPGPRLSQTAWKDLCAGKNSPLAQKCRDLLRRLFDADDVPAAITLHPFPVEDPGCGLLGARLLTPGAFDPIGALRRPDLFLRGFEYDTLRRERARLGGAVRAAEDLAQFPMDEMGLLAKLAADVQSVIPAEFVTIFTTQHLDVVARLTLGLAPQATAPDWEERFRRGAGSLVGRVMDPEDPEYGHDGIAVENNLPESTAVYRATWQRHVARSRFGKVPHALIVSVDGPNRRIGAIRALNRIRGHGELALSPDGFTLKDAEELRKIAQRYGSILAKHRAEVKIKTIFEINERLLPTGVGDTSTLNDILARMVRPPVSYSAAALYVHDGSLLVRRGAAARPDNRTSLVGSHSCDLESGSPIELVAGLVGAIVASPTSATVRDSYCTAEGRANVIAFPLTGSGEDFFGVLVLMAEPGYEFLNYEREFLKMLADQMALWLRTQSLLRQRDAVAARLADTAAIFGDAIADIASPTTRLTTHLNAIATRARVVLEAERLTVFLLHGEDLVRIAATAGERKDEVAPAPECFHIGNSEGGGLTGFIAHTLKTKDTSLGLYDSKAGVFRAQGPELRELPCVRHQEPLAPHLRCGTFHSVLAAPFWNTLLGDPKERYFMGMIVAYNKHPIGQQGRRRLEYSASDAFGFGTEDVSIITMLAKKITLLYEVSAKAKKPAFLREIKDRFAAVDPVEASAAEYRTTGSFQTAIDQSIRGVLKKTKTDCGLVYECPQSLTDINEEAHFRLIAGWQRGVKVTIPNFLTLTAIDFNAFADLPGSQWVRVVSASDQGEVGAVPFLSVLAGAVSAEEPYKSGLAMLLKSRGGKIRFLVVFFAIHERFFVYDRRGLIDDAIDAVCESYNSQRERIQHQRLDQKFRTISEVVQSAIHGPSSKNDLDDLIRAIEEKLLVHTGAECMRITLFNETEGTLWRSRVRRCVRRNLESCDICFFEWGADHLDPVLHRNARLDEEIFLGREDLKSIQTELPVLGHAGCQLHNYFRVPLKPDDAYIGEIAGFNRFLSDGESRSYLDRLEEEDKQFVRLIGSCVSMAIRSALEKYRQGLRTGALVNVNSIHRAVLHERDFRKVYFLLLLGVTHGAVGAANRAFLFKLHRGEVEPLMGIGPHSDGDKHKKWYGERSSYPRDVRELLSEGPSNYRTRHTAVLDEIEPDQNVSALLPRLIDYVGGSALLTYRKGEIRVVGEDGRREPFRVGFATTDRIEKLNSAARGDEYDGPVSPIPDGQFFLREIDVGRWKYLLLGDNLYNGRPVDTFVVDRLIDGIGSILSDRLNEEDKLHLLRAISHEVKGGLTPITGWAWYLKELARPEVAPQARRVERLLSRAVERMRDSAQAYIEHDSGSVRPQLGPVDVGVLLAEEIDWHRNAGGCFDVSRDVQGAEPGRCIARADRRMVAFILSNLLSNAEKAVQSEPRPRIACICGTRDDDILISVADNGTGIRQEYVEHVFDRFEHDFPAGHGVGLYVARQYAEMQGGELTLQWTEVGRGSAFQLRLPRAGGEP